MNQPLLEIKDLKKHFHTPAGTLHAVDGVSLSLRHGETLGIVGESGCGKSTLGRTILKLEEPTDGQILFHGQDITHLNEKNMRPIRQSMQMIFQDPYSSLNPRMTVGEIIAYPLKVNKLCKNRAERMEKVLQLMESVELSQRFFHSYPHELDGGRRQRIGIARALALDPEFIVCDEPVSALDVSVQAQILNLLMDLQEERHLSYLFITHNLSVVKHISNRIAVMYMGKCVELAETEALFSNPLHPYTKALLHAIPVADPNIRFQKQEILRGEVTTPVNPAPGCRFAPRCPYASESCSRSDIPLTETSPGHFVACLCKNTQV